MNDEEFENQYGQNPDVNRFESPEQISKHIFGVENSKARAFNKDTSRGNLELPELNSVKVCITLINEIYYAEQTMVANIIKDKTILDENKKTKIDEIQDEMERLRNFYLSEQEGTVVPSRSKRGYAIYMAKTERNVQQQDMTTYGMEQQEGFTEGNPPGLKDKITGAVPFLKKKGV